MLERDVLFARRMMDNRCKLKQIEEYALDLDYARRRIAELEQGIAAIGSAMGSDRLTPIEIERLIREGNTKATQMYSEFAAARDRVAELEKDAERLNWLESRKDDIGWNAKSWVVISKTIHVVNCPAGDLWVGDDFTHETLRSAIDAAIAATRQKGEE